MNYGDAILYSVWTVCILTLVIYLAHKDRTFWRTVRSVTIEMFREGPGLWAESVDRSILREHAPFDVAGDGTGPAICVPCKREWPCDRFMAADRRIDDRINNR